MSGWQGVYHSCASGACCGRLRAILRILSVSLLLYLVPPDCLCQGKPYYQINIGSGIVFGDESASRFWNSGPSVGGEVGCYLGENLSPSIGLSYNLLTIDWDEVGSQDTWVIDTPGKRSYILAGSFSLKASDFEDKCVLKSYISLGTTFLVRRTARVRFDGWHTPPGMQCQGGTGGRASESEDMVLIDLGSGLGVGAPGGCVALIQAKLSIHPGRGFIYLPIEFGLRF